MKAQIFEFSCWLHGASAEGIKQDVTDLLEISGHTILGQVGHKFEPQGYTHLWLLGESHAAIHTYPEHNATFLQLSSCSEPKYKHFRRTLTEDWLFSNLVENVSTF